MTYFSKLLLCAALVTPSVSLASDQTFNFNLPSFSGNGATTSYYTALLEAQKRPEETFDEQSTLEGFTEDLERRLLSSLATDIVNEIFGDDAASSGSFTVGGLDVIFDTVNGDVVVNISDGITTTEITVPGI